jgi:hypothetical protein
LHWTRQAIIDEIRRLHKAKEDMSFAALEQNHLSLMRAAAWHYGTWRRAVEEAGIDYETLSRYKRWSKARIIARIQELYAEGHDLSWRSISQTVDPALAASALRPNGFGSWPEAIAAAGLDISEVARYKYWNTELVLKTIKERHKAGVNLSSRNAQKNDQSLFCAARRRYGTWDKALEAAGLDVSTIRIRKPPHAGDPAAVRAGKNSYAWDRKMAAEKATAAKNGSKDAATKTAPKTATKKVAKKAAAPKKSSRSVAKPVKKAATTRGKKTA